MTAVRMWVGLDLRRRWRSLTVLALLVALASGTIMATLAGARRGASAVERLQEGTLPTTVVVLANTPGFDWSKVEALPDVAALTRFVVGTPYTVDGVPFESEGFPPGDDETMRTIEKPVVVAGRLFDPARADEVVVSRNFVAKQHRGVGDMVTIRLPRPDELEAIQNSDDVIALHGPVVRARIVGVVLSPWFNDAQASDTGFIQPSPGLAARYRANVVGNDRSPDDPVNQNAMVRLSSGEAGITAFTQRFQQLTHRSDIEMWNRAEQLQEFQHHIRFESQNLAACALAVFAAALFLIGQAIVRYTAGSTSELQTLRAIGMTPRQAVLTASIGPSAFGAAGILIGVAGAVAASSLFPFGLAERLEPRLGTTVDGLVLGGISVLVLLLVAAGAASSAWVALISGRRDGSHRRSAIAGAIRRAGFGVPVVVGTRFALEPGRGRTSVPVRPALLGAVVGVIGIVAAFTFAHGVADAGQHPERFGQTFQLGTYIGMNDQNFGPQQEVFTATAAQPDVAGIDDARTAVATGANDVSASLWQYDPGPKPLPIVITSGRLPKAADEVVLAPRSLAALHTAVGRTVVLTGSRPGAKTFSVVGSGFVPIGPHNNYSDGGWLSKAGYDALFKGFKFRIQLVSLRPGTDVDAASKRLALAVEKAVPAAKGVTFEVNRPPAELAAIREVQVLPIALGLFLALLALGAVGHAVATAVRRRSIDIAVLRALGMTRWQSRWVVVTQATVLAVVGLVFGVPLGFALGRSIWRWVANYTPLEYVPPLAFWTLLLVGPLALLAANLLAAWPGYQAARLRVAYILRAE